MRAKHAKHSNNKNKNQNNMKRLVLFVLVAITCYWMTAFDSSRYDYTIVAPDTTTTTNITSSTHQAPPPPANYLCVYIHWPAGWGNAMLRLLYRMLVNARYDNDKGVIFPCVRGYGGIFSQLFANLEACPMEDPVEPCHGYPRDDGWTKAPWTTVRSTIFDDKHYQQFLPSLLQLNETFVQEVFQFTNNPLNLKDWKQQSSSCAVHVRFGDFYIRDGTNYTAEAQKKLETQRRACKDPTDVTACFEQVLHTITNDHCPNPNVPLYIATDFANFTRYLCSHVRDRTLMSPCDEDSINARAHHSNDVPLLDAEGILNPNVLPSFYALLSDWLALALAQNTSRIAHSTFSETPAQLEFQAV